MTLTNTVMDDNQAAVSGIGLRAKGSVLWFSSTLNYGGGGIFNVMNVVMGTPAFAVDGYHLSNDSQAIDQGVNSGVTTDIDGSPRPMRAGYDLGADEYGYETYLPLIKK